jgi:Skp family chaperone for outer membrane proteins
MKKVFVTLVLALLVTTFSYAQDATKIAQFKSGDVLSATQMGFINVIASGPEKARGAAAEATIDNTKFSAGKTLTAAEADLLNTKAAKYGKTQKEMTAKARGAICYYLYCDGYGNCWYIYYNC